MSRYDYNSGKNLDIEIVVEWAEADENNIVEWAEADGND